MKIIESHIISRKNGVLSEKKSSLYIFLSLEFGESEFLSLYDLFEFGERECKLSLQDLFDFRENENDLSIYCPCPMTRV